MFHTRFLVMAPADDDKGGGGTVDRGDDLDPTLIDEVEDEQEDKSKEQEEEEEEEEEEADPKAKAKGGDKEKDDEEEEEDEAKGKRRDKRMIPKDRYDRATDRLRRENEELRNQLKRTVRQRQDEDEVATTAALETKLTELEAKYDKALADNDTEQAAKLSREIRRVDREITEASATRNAEARVTASMNARALDRRVIELEQLYPEVNPEHEDYDKAATAKVLRLQRGLVSQGEDPVEAMNEAVELVFGKPATKRGKDGDEAEGLRSKRREDAVKRGADAQRRQPERTTRAGADSDKRGARPDGSKALSLGDLDKLTPAQLAAMRGDAG